MYQIQVSIWLSLEFLVRRHLADSVELEPLEGEDLEILRRESDEDTSERTTGLSVALHEPRRYLVQTKTRRTDHWTVAELVEILKGKKKEASTRHRKRQYPFDVMTTDTNAALLFVTNNTIQDELVWFLENDVCFAARTSTPTTSAKGSWNNDLSSIDMGLLARVGVLQQYTFLTIEQIIDKILAENLNVPYSARPGCHEALERRFRKAMLDEQSIVTHDELLEIGRKNGGLPEGPRLFVPPRNWDEIQTFLETNHAIILCGEQGTGKTTLAERLLYDHRKLPEPYEVFRPKSPNETAPPPSAGRKIIHISDPFGQYEPHGHADEWATWLSKLKDDRRKDLRVVITTPEAFAGGYLDDPTFGLKPFRFDIKGSMFDGPSLLEAHVDDRGLDSGARTWLADHKLAIALELDRPFSYQSLLNLVADVPANQRTDTRMRGLILEARDAIHGIELENVFLKGGHDSAVVAGLAAIWMALGAWPHEALETRLAALEDLLLGSTPPVDVNEAAVLLRKYRMLKLQRSVERMHPIYLRRCRDIFKGQKRMAAMQVAATILDGYLKNRRYHEAVPLLGFLKGQGLLPTSVSTRAKNLLQAKLPAALQGNDAAATGPLLEILALTGDPAEPDVVLAASLFVRHEHSDFFSNVWSDPQWSDDIKERVRTSRDAQTIARTFLRQRLFTGWLFGASEMVKFLYDLFDLSPEFDDLAPHIEKYHESFPRELIIRGHARSRNTTPDSLVEAMLASQKRYEDWSRRVPPSNEDFTANQEHLNETAGEFVSEVHAHVDAILDLRGPEWAATRKEPYVFECYGRRVNADTDPEVFRRVLDACPPDARADMLLKIEDPRVGLEYTLRSLHAVPPDSWQELFAHHVRDRHRRIISSAAKESARKQLAAELGSLPSHVRVGLAHEFHAKNFNIFDDIFLAQFTAEERLAADALAHPEAPPPAEVRGTLEALAASPMPAAGAALRTLAAAGTDLEPLLLSSLESDRYDTVHAALYAATMVPTEKRILYASIAFTHELAEIRVHALRALKDCPGDRAIDEITSLIEDPTDSVRLAVVEALRGRSEPAAWRALLRLSDDRADTSEAAYQGNSWWASHRPERGVADAAKHALLELEPKSNELIAALDQRFPTWRPANRHST